MNLLTLRRREFAARVSDVGVMETEQAASRQPPPSPVDAPPPL
jgi:hypothetical protein